MISLLSQFSGMASAVKVADEQKRIADAKKGSKQGRADRVLESRRKSGETRSRAVQLRYAEVFKTPITVGRASAILDIGHVACLNQCYRYEKRGLMKREDYRDPETGTLLFTWIGDLA